MKPAPRRVWLPWLLLLVPTLLIGGVALRLLWQEQRRLGQAAEQARRQTAAAAQARAQVAADNIELLVSEIRDGLLRELAETPEHDLEALLANWPRTNPLVAQTFLWRPDRAALAWPPADTFEHRQFRERHAALFAPGQSSLTATLEAAQEEGLRQLQPLPAAMPEAEDSADQLAPTVNFEVMANQAARREVQQSSRLSAAAAKKLEPPLAKDFGRKRTADTGRAQSESAAKTKGYMDPPEHRSEKFFFGDEAAPASPAPAIPEADVRPSRSGPAPVMDPATGPWSEPASGWLGRTVGRSVYFLGWWQPAGGGAVRGVELNLPAVLERVQALVPAATAEGERFLLCGPGQTREAGAIQIPLTTTLPGWALLAFPGADYGSLPSGGEAGFFVVAVLLVVVFLASILAGGAIFFRQAAASEREAALKTSFVSNVSHEMKTPLTTIRMYAEMLADERVAEPAKRARYFATIGRETARLTRLVNNVLDFGRLEAGRKEYRPEAVALGPWLARLVETYAPRAGEAGVRIVATPVAPGAAVRCDPDTLDQVALNLIDNAIKYGAAGGIVELHADPVAGGWAFVVADRGPGVPATHRERIFDRFHRVDESLTAKAQGAGLGLTIARRLARDQGGDLVCHERKGGGAVFVLSLPAATAPET